MTTNDHPSPRRPRPTLRDEWCRCETFPADGVFMPDFLCPCGVDKHHDHCPACGGIAQVG